MNAPKKRPSAEKKAAPGPAEVTAAAETVNSAPQTAAPAPGVTVAGTVDTRPDDVHPGEVISAPAEAQLEAAALALATEAPAATAGLAFIAPGGTPAAGVLDLDEPADATLAAIAPTPNARALRRVEHDGKAYGPDEEAGDMLALSGSELLALQAISAVEALH